ncbi:MAG: hypothetical protein HC875_27935 [Anaerolineales bacterium]|nr:hypothetical protein [Anaerolineales bacterium]
MSDSFESILDESISALQAGIPVEEILAEAPEYAAQLRPLLFAATVLADPNPRLVAEERKSALRAVYMQQVADLPAQKPPTFNQKAQAVSRIIRRRATPKGVLSDLATVIVTVILTLLMTLLLLSFAAQAAVPGDLLYSLKRSSEAVQLGLAFGEAQWTGLNQQFNQRRLAEIEQLIQQDRAAVVDFRGVLETKGENLWIIAGQTIFLPTDVILEGQPQEGDEVEVMGFLRTNEVLVADTIRVIK